MMLPELEGINCMTSRYGRGARNYWGNDEAAATMCAWATRGASCFTVLGNPLYNFARIGPAGGMKGADKFSGRVFNAHVGRAKTREKWECLMFVHVWPRDEVEALYALANSGGGHKGGHESRECGLEGADLFAVNATTKAFVHPKFHKLMVGRVSRVTFGNDGKVKQKQLLALSDFGEKSCNGAALHHVVLDPSRGKPEHDITDSMLAELVASAAPMSLTKEQKETRCQCIAEAFGISHGVTWGTATGKVRDEWVTLQCGHSAKGGAYRYAAHGCNSHATHGHRVMPPMVVGL
jgi:hypothetical protein